MCFGLHDPSVNRRVVGSDSYHGEAQLIAARRHMLATASALTPHQLARGFRLIVCAACHVGLQYEQSSARGRTATPLRAIRNAPTFTRKATHNPSDTEGKASSGAVTCWTLEGRTP